MDTSSLIYATAPVLGSVYEQEMNVRKKRRRKKKKTELTDRNVEKLPATKTSPVMTAV